jgi:hypothetical protein
MTKKPCLLAFCEMTAMDKFTPSKQGRVQVYSAVGGFAMNNELSEFCILIFDLRLLSEF